MFQQGKREFLQETRLCIEYILNGSVRGLRSTDFHRTSRLRLDRFLGKESLHTRGTQLRGEASQLTLANEWPPLQDRKEWTQHRSQLHSMRRSNLYDALQRPLLHSKYRSDAALCQPNSHGLAKVSRSWEVRTKPTERAIHIPFRNRIHLAHHHQYSVGLRGA